MHTIYQHQPFWNLKRELRILFVLLLPAFASLVIYIWAYFTQPASYVPEIVRDLKQVFSALTAFAFTVWLFLLFVRGGLRLLR